MEHSIRPIETKEKDLVDTLYSQHEEVLALYAELLLWWNDKINLVSRDVSRETVTHHIKHSLFISLFASFNSSERIIDTGAGGGLPGIPLALCFPGKEFILNDIVTKKIFSVNDMVNKLSLHENVRGIAGDVAQLKFEGIDTLVTKHAFKIDQLFSLIEKKPWKTILFLKGHKEAIEEVKSLKGKVKMSLIKLDSEFMPEFYSGKGVVEIERI